MIAVQYDELVRDVALGYQDSTVEVKVVVTVRSMGEIIHRVTEVMTHSEDDAMSQALDTAIKLSSGKLDADEE
jgi:hypothetical protein